MLAGDFKQRGGRLAEQAGAANTEDAAGAEQAAPQDDGVVEAEFEEVKEDSK